MLTPTGLRGAPLLYVFLETRDLNEQRAALEHGLGLPLIEVEPHPPDERHGVVKYDAGGLVLSLNISTPSRFADTGSDALALVFDGPPPDRVPGVTRRDLAEGVLLTDRHGHHYLFRGGRPSMAAADSSRTRSQVVVANAAPSRRAAGARPSTPP